MECFLCRMSLPMKQLMCTLGKWYWFTVTGNHRLSSPDLSLCRLIWDSLCGSYSQTLSIVMCLCSWWFSSGRFICKDRLPVPLNVTALKPLGWPEAHWFRLIKLPVRKATAGCLLQHCSKPLGGRKKMSFRQIARSFYRSFHVIIFSSSASLKCLETVFECLDKSFSMEINHFIWWLFPRHCYCSWALWRVAKKSVYCQCHKSNFINFTLCNGKEAFRNSTAVTLDTTEKTT